MHTSLHVVRISRAFGALRFAPALGGGKPLLALALMAWQHAHMQFTHAWIMMYGYAHAHAAHISPLCTTNAVGTLRPACVLYLSNLLNNICATSACSYCPHS